jgi:WD40 repeat protein
MLKCFIHKLLTPVTGMAFLMLLTIPGYAQSGNAGVKVFKKHSAPVKALAFSPDGKTLATGGDDKMIYLWDLASGELIGSISNGFSIKALSFSDNDHLLAACGNDIKLMDRQGNLIRTFSGYTTNIWSFSYNQPTQRITAGSYGKSIRVWDFSTTKTSLTLEGHERSSLPVCFSPKGDVIASGSLDKSVRLWDANTGKVEHIMELHSENIFAIDFHPSGKYLASASADKTIRLWDADSGKIIRTFTGHNAGIFDVQFSADGLHMISCDAGKTIILWETATGRKVNTYTGHTGAVNAVRFNPNGSGFASASDDGTVRYWPLEKKDYLEETYFTKKIEEAVSGSKLFEPRAADETKQKYAERQAEADKFLEALYDQYYQEYIETLKQLSIEPQQK